MDLILKSIIKKINNKNIFISNKNDVYFLTRFSSSNLSIMIINKKWYALTDSRYIEAAEKNIKNMDIINVSKKGWLENLIKKNNFDKIAFNKKDTTLKDFELYTKAFMKYKIEVLAEDFGNLRSIYLDSDIKLLKEASKINDELMEFILKKIKVDMTELEIKNLILKKIIDSIADYPSFDPIVASGKSSSNPHWSPTNKKIKNGEMITIDIGIYYKGFASDMTRTFVIGGKISKEEEEIWNVVKDALYSSIKMIKPGVKVKDLHKHSLDVIDEKGYKKYFTHSLGHGLGVDIHDAPNISIYSEEILQEGMVITIEPGIYIPGKYGVRLEQAILVTKNGSEILNKLDITMFI